MNPASGHLTNAQIRDYVTDSTPDLVAQKWLAAHLADCESCLNRVLEAERTSLGLLEGDGMKRTPYPGCPAEETLQELAAGICGPDIAETTTEHAAHCDYCGPVLSRYMKEFSDDLPAEDAAILGQLKTSTPAWQKKFVRENSPQPKKSWFTFWPKVVTAAATAAVAVGGYVVLIPPTLDQLVAKAYAERRTTEMRLTAVNFGKYKPLDVQMGPDDIQKLDFKRPELLNAKSRLVAKLTSQAQPDPHLLELEGRITLLENPGNAEEAEKIFKDAQSRGLNDPDLLIDLAASYFEADSKSDQGNQENPDRLRFARTTELLIRALKNQKLTSAQKAVAEFDLALAYEKTESWDLAATAWNTYLTLDQDSQWRAEAQEHLNKIKDDHKLPPPKPQSYKEPGYLLGHVSEPMVGRDIEQFQEIALGKWLTKAIEDPTSDASHAAHEIANIFQQQHTDDWWSEFLKVTTSSDLPAVRALSAAMVDAENDLAYEAMTEARKSEEIFARRHNLPGELLAGFAEVYALQRGLSADLCLRRATLLGKRLERTNYHWLQGQVALEQAACANLISDYRTSDASLEASLNVANEFHFQELLLRVDGIGAGIKRLRAKYGEAWDEGIDGLRLYWHNSYSSARLYQFYTVMRLCAKEEELFNTAEALLRRSIEVLEADAPDDISLRIVLYQRLANLLEQSGDSPAAEAEFEKARDLLQRLPVGESTAQIYPALPRIELAEFELGRRDAHIALSTLEPVQNVLANRDDFMALRYYKVLGNAHLQLGQLEEASSAYWKGIHLAEQAMGGLKDDASRLAWIQATDGIYRGIVQVLLAKKDDTGALGIWEYSKSRSLDHGNGVPRLMGRSQQPSLPPVSYPHLIFASFEDRLQIWAVQGSQVRSLSVAMKQIDLHRLVRKFAENCASPDQAPSLVPQQAQELYMIFLKPVVSALAASAIVSVELDQPLSDLPVEALESPEGKSFGVDYAVVRSPGILVEDTLRKARPSNPGDAFLVVDTSPRSGSRYLQGHEKATEAIVRLFPNARVLAPGDATSTKIRTELEASVAFHFTGHGIRSGTGAVLELTPDSFLTAHDLSLKSLHSLRLAVLDACSSAPTANNLLDTSNLVGALLAGRTPDVVASHWNVESQSTAQLMESFYHHLASEPVAQALRDARKDMRHIYNHPYYWASFSLIGRAS